LEFNSTTPIYLQIADVIRRRILAGEWKQGERISPVRELSLEMGVNPNTAQRAVVQLETEGLLRAERTSGRYVTTDVSVIDQARQALTAAEIEKCKASLRGLGYNDGEIAELFARHMNERSEDNG
jgi:DNA-binding transcriptional regulator YhcF (GntR family)